jgi:VanZ family protein
MNHSSRLACAGFLWIWNRKTSSLVLWITLKISRVQYKIQFLKFGREKLKTERFFDLSINFFSLLIGCCPVFYLKFNFGMKNSKLIDFFWFIAHFLFLFFQKIKI